jgi:predicted naringenin-chalcone synthase
MPDTIIAGLGSALPENRFSTERYIEHAKRFSCTNPRQEKVLEELYRRTAIAQRGSICTEEAFPSAQTEQDHGPTTGHRMQYYAGGIGALAKRACDEAFAKSAISREEITHIVTVSCTGFYAPGFDIELIHSLPLKASTKRTHVGFMGCHGGMNGLRVAQAYAQADPSARILLCTAEACSLHFQYGWGPDKLVANSLFADGAAAAIIRGDAERDFQNECIIVDTASYIIPESTDQMLWRIGDNGFEMHLAATVPALIEEWLPNFLEEWLAQHDLRVADIAGWAVHPGGPKILDSVQQCLHLSLEALAPSREILATCGNMSSPTVFFILQNLQRRNVKGHCVVLGFGPGLTVEAALLHQSDISAEDR